MSLTRARLIEVAQRAIDEYQGWLENDTPGISSHPTLAASVVDAVIMASVDQTVGQYIIDITRSLSERGRIAS